MSISYVCQYKFKDITEILLTSVQLNYTFIESLIQ